MKTVLFVINSLGQGGAERQLLELIKGMKGKVFCHLCLVEKEGRDFLAELEPFCESVYSLERCGKFDVLPALHLARYAKKIQADLIHCFLPLACAYGVVAAKIAGIPCVSSAIRDAKDATWKKRWLIKLLSASSDYMVSNSRAGLLNRFRSIKPHMRVIYNGYTESRFALDSQQLSLVESFLAKDGAESRICMAAGLAGRKDHETLLRAFSRLVKTRPSVHLYLIGDGPLRKNIHEQIAELGISSSVSMLGYRDDVLYLLKNMDISVLLTNDTVHEEGLSNSLIESMYLGVPVVATATGGTKELIQPDQGMLVPPFNVDSVLKALNTLLSSEERRKNISEAALAGVRRLLSFEMFIGAYLNLYEDVD